MTDPEHPGSTHHEHPGSTHHEHPGSTHHEHSGSIHHERSADEEPWYDTVVLTVLLRTALRTLGEVVRYALAEQGYDDLPRNGSFVLGAIRRGSLESAELPSALGVSKQAYSQLVDTLVARSYLSREPDPEDRRRIVLSLTHRGAAASRVAAAAAQATESVLRDSVTDADVRTARRVLAAMANVPHDATPHDATPHDATPLHAP